MQPIKAKDLKENPRESANICSKLMFCYALRILFKGWDKPLEPTDLYRNLKSHQADTLGGKLSRIWEEEYRKYQCGNRSEPSIYRVILRVFGWQLFKSGIILGVLEIGLRATQPLLLARLIREFSEGATTSLNAYVYAACLLASIAGAVLITHPFMMNMMHLAMKMRVAMCSTIYRKALRLNRSALGDTTTGQIVNLLSNDLARFDRSLIHLHFMWLAPLELCFASYFMYQAIEVSTFSGICLMLLFLPLQLYLGKLIAGLRLRTALATDKRVRMMNEIISGIQVIKMYGWELPFGKLIGQVRQREMNVIRRVNYVRGILLSFEVFVARISIFASLLVFVLLGGNHLTAEKAFFVTAFFNTLRRTVTKFFPQGMSQLSELLISLRRIKVFLMHEEKVKIIKISAPRAMEDSTLGDELVEVQFTDFNAKWDALSGSNAGSSYEYTLKDINLHLEDKQMIAVVGTVGSGKSSLIEAILGELAASTGVVRVAGRISYAPQIPWLFTGTVRDNILFGQRMDERRYRRVVNLCALKDDFKLLPDKDKTIVGERGASLSGGQKARISLARAVYRESDIYLLDDPLSAVDTHVAEHLFEQCIRKFLAHKLVVLVTHQLQFVEHADRIVLMDKGSIRAIASSYQALLDSGEDYVKLLPEASNGDSGTFIEDASSSLGLSRQGSRVSQLSDCHASNSTICSFTDTEPEPNACTLLQEKRKAGHIDLGSYKRYFSAGGGALMFGLVVFLCIGTQVLGSGADYFLSHWVKNKHKEFDTNESKMTEIYWFSVLNVALVIFALLRSFLFFNLANKSSKSIHDGMFNGVSHAAMHFFHSNPSGRVLNRFSMDIGQMDEILPQAMIDVIQILLSLIGIVIVLCVTNPWYVITTLALILAFYYIRVFYLRTSRDVKRIEAVARSPMYSHLASTLNGLSTVRAFGAESMLTADFDNYQDVHSSGYFAYLCTNRAFGYYLDCFCVVYIAIVIISYILYPPDNPGKLGLAITQALGMTGMVQWGMRQSAEVENSMTAVERILEYKLISPEGAFASDPLRKPPKEWPQQGRVVASGLSMRYNPQPESKRVLKRLNFEIKPCEKVGIVGRTGAGKSSLINTLFRLSYNEGSIVIDNRDTSEIGLHDLRSKISIIPQEPVLFSGTMRYNLDPFDEYSDEKLWSVLEEVKLKEAISELSTGLESCITEGGSNFSVGQRQLVCLARAILRENKILVMDEATANVDPQTDALIQTTIRQKFENCTVLTIAHRLNTIVDSDRILVMVAGEIVESGAPYELLTSTEHHVFCDMVKQMGDTSFENLLAIAEKAHAEKEALSQSS